MKNKQDWEKFRAWDKKNRKMYFYTFEDLLEGKIYTYPNCLDYEWSKFIRSKDKNEIEIYEMDILKVVFPNDTIVMGIIEYDNLTYKLKQIKQSSEAIKHGYTDYIEYWDDGDNDWYSLEQIFGDEIEILGNIYENPELLEDKK